MRLSDFDYQLPEELIATEPANPRDAARLLVLPAKQAEWSHHQFRDLPDLLVAGDCLLLNNSRVIPARLSVERLDEYGQPTGGQGEVFLLNRRHDLSDEQTDYWQCLVRGRTKQGALMRAGELTMALAEAGGDGTWLVKFALGGAALMAFMDEHGQVPLPPYIEKRRRELGDQQRLVSDKQEYQTVYSDQAPAGSVAAPTAGLHFTPELLDKLRAKGVRIVTLTLHVGLGTFLPVKTDDVSQHKMHAEWTEVPAATIEAIKETKARGGRLVAVGTTSARAIEACWQAGAPAEGWSAWVDIFIYPGYRWLVLDGLITNFHLPKSTLLMLVSALAGKQRIEAAYQEAIKQGYRFYSYGDAMLIWP